ncbi:MAG: glycosyltransferase family 4 protein [Phycisphaerae bacterium]
MKIGLVVEWLDPSRGGAERSTGEFVSQLLSRGVSLEVFTRSGVPSKPGMNVHTIETTAWTRAGATAQFIRAAENAIGEAGCDLIHALTPCQGAQVYQPRGGTVAETIRRTLSTRRSAAARALKRAGMAFNARQRLVLAKERAWLTGDRRPIVIAISQYVAQQLRHHYSYPDSYIRHILNGVEVTESTPAERARDRDEIRKMYGIGDDELLLLAVCHNFRLKGVGCLIEALSAVVRSGGVTARALVVGRGHRRRWGRLARRFGVGDVIGFCGAAERVDAFFHAADVLVHPTYYDPCSRVVLEAVSRGLPAISTRFDGACEAIEDGVSGFVLPSPEASDALASRIRILADDGVRRRMSAAAKRKAGLVSMQRHTEEVCGVYEGLLARAAGSR